MSLLVLQLARAHQNPIQPCFLWNRSTYYFINPLVGLFITLTINIMRGVAMFTVAFSLTDVFIILCNFNFDNID